MLGFLGRRAAQPRPSQVLREGLYAEAEHEKCEDTIADNVLTPNVDETCKAHASPHLSAS